MLDSLERNIQPTRAEVTDVFFAVERGADATMLSGESAQGQFPVQAVYTMRQINKKSELLFDYYRAIS
jgi:pyruvate kinase